MTKFSDLINQRESYFDTGDADQREESVRFFFAQLDKIPLADIEAMIVTVKRKDTQEGLIGFVGNPRELRGMLMGATIKLADSLSKAEDDGKLR